MASLVQPHGGTLIDRVVPAAEIDAFRSEAADFKMRHFLEVVRGALLRGAGVAELARPLISLVVLGAGIFVLAAARFRKRLA